MSFNFVDRSNVVESKNWPLDQLPGLSQEDLAKLADCGISTTLQLLQNTQTMAEKQALATKLQVHIQHLNKWIALADLARVPSVGCHYCGVLLHAGVSSPIYLKQMSIPRLRQQVLKLQVATLQRQDLCPSFDEVSGWIRDARSLSTFP